MTPRKILIVVVFIAALLAILIAVSGPHGDAGIKSSVTTVHSSDIIAGKVEPADYTEGVVYQDQEEIGRIAFETLLETIAEKQVANKIYVPFKIIEGNTVKDLRASCSQKS